MKNNHHSPRRLTALLLVVAVMLSLIPSAFAAQQNSYHDPAEHWREALNRTNELDANSVVTVETFNCCVCDKATAFEVFRVPEYTRNGETALTRNVKYSDGTCLDGESKGDLLDGTPGQDATYTGYHWTKAVCEVCGTINSNMGATSYACNKNVYWLYDCAADFFEELPETQTVEQADSTYWAMFFYYGNGYWWEKGIPAQPEDMDAYEALEKKIMEEFDLKEPFEWE